LNEDCSYRADRVDQFLTVLWHPHEDRLVGIKLKGFRFLFERIKNVLELDDDQFLPLVKAIEIALVGGVAESIMDEQRQARLKTCYDEARKIAIGVSFDSRELKAA
jgi:hypothetical protein